MKRSFIKGAGLKRHMLYRVLDKNIADNRDEHKCSGESFKLPISIGKDANSFIQ